MLDQILKVLEHLAKRPDMHVSRVDIATVQAYLHGLEVGCSLAGLFVSREVYVQTAAARGWKWRAAGIEWHMRKKGFDEMAVIQELIAVQAEAFRRAAAVPADAAASAIRADNKGKGRDT